MSEKIRLRGNSRLLKPVISQIIAIRKLIENRDVGDIVAAPVIDAVKATPHTIKLTIFFYSESSPPFRKVANKQFVEARYNIPDVKRSMLDWEIIKQAAGGQNGYVWGRFSCTANLDNGRKMQVYGASESEAEQRLKALAALSEAKIVSLNVTEEKKEGERAVNKILYKESVRVYPGYFTILNSEKIVTESNRELEGLTGTLAGNFKRKRTKKIPLWVTKEPPNCKALIREALRVRGSSVR